MFKRRKREYNSKMPQWFKEWDMSYFKPVESRSTRNERLFYIILIAVVGMNTVGNFYHEEMVQFFVRLFGV